MANTGTPTLTPAADAAEYWVSLTTVGERRSIPIGPAEPDGATPPVRRCARSDPAE